MKTQKSFSIEEIQRKMEHFCAYRERCHKEIEQKLREFHLIPEGQSQIIQHLIAHNFLNETRFASAFARGKFRIKKWGKRRIIQELKQRDISAYNLKKALAEIDDATYNEVFYELTQKKWESLKDLSKQKRSQRFISHFNYRGWESGLIYERLRELEENIDC